MRAQQKQKRSLRLVAKPTLRVYAYSSAILLLTFLITFFYFNFSNPQNARGAPGFHGAKTVSSANTKINEYTSITADAAAGASTITVASSSLNANARFSGSLAAGELVMIIQMQGATITTTNDSTYGTVSSYINCGKYEFDEVSAIPNGTSITLSKPLKNSYTASCKTQVVRVPRYTKLTVNAGASVIADAWNGVTGGIVSIEANDTIEINGTIDVSGKGFRGGRVKTTNNSLNPQGDRVNWKNTNTKMMS